MPTLPSRCTGDLPTGNGCDATWKPSLLIRTVYGPGVLLPLDVTT